MVEVLMVIMIISVLMAIGTGVGWYVMSKAEADKTKATMEIVMTALERYREVNVGNLTHADAIGDGAINDDGSGGVDPNSFKKLFDKTTDAGAAAIVMLEQLPDEAVESSPQILDGFGKNFRYSETGGLGGTPRLQSAGSDGEWDTDDDIYSDK